MNTIKINKCIPQNDLDCYYNSKWKQIYKIYGDDENVDNFTLMQKKINDELFDIIIESKLITDNIKITNENKVTNNLVIFRNSYIDRDKHFAFFTKFVNKIIKISTIDELINVIKIMSDFNIPTLFTLTITQNFTEPDVYALFVGEFPLTMETRETYDDCKPKFIHNFTLSLRKIYYFIQQKWNYNLSKINVFTQNILLFEYLFSKYNLYINQLENHKLTHNSLSYDIFLKLFDTNNFWYQILGKYLKLSSNIVFQNPASLSFIKKYIQFLASTDDLTNDLTMIKDYLIYSLIKEYGIYTEISPSIDLMTNTFTDPKELLVQTFCDTFGYYLQSIYEKKHYNKKKINLVNQMFIEMKDYFFNYFDKTSIFENTTKMEAIAKINSMDIIIGSTPNTFIEYLIPILNKNFYANMMVIKKIYFQQMINLIDKKINRHLITINNDIYSFMANAYYEPSTNIIYIPTCMLNNYFIKLDVDPIYNYGCLGAIIGHEMMHAFDTYGSAYDHLGHYRNWWTKKDLLKYYVEINKVFNHYSLLSINGCKINSELSVSENIADIAGLKLSLRTYINKYMKNINMKKLTISEKNHIKKFFESWAETLRTIQSIQSFSDSCEHIKYDIHSPSTIRINAPFAHIDEYYDIFDVQPIHNNYLKKELRTKILDLD